MRQGVVWILIALAGAMGVFTYMGRPLLGIVYGVALVGVSTLHWLYGCRRCTNVACAINPKSPDFFLRPTQEGSPADLGYSDVDAKVAGVPLMAVLGLGLVGTWLYDAVAGLAVTVALGLAAAVYWRETCAECTNDCPANRNPAYRDWKRGNDQPGKGGLDAE